MDWPWNPFHCLGSPDRYYGTDCEESLFFFCNTKPGTSSEFIPESKTLVEAGKHCLGLKKKLAVLPERHQVSETIIIRDFPVWVGVPPEGKNDSSAFCPEPVYWWPPQAKVNNKHIRSVLGIMPNAAFTRKALWIYVCYIIYIYK